MAHLFIVNTWFILLACQVLCFILTQFLQQSSEGDIILTLILQMRKQEHMEVDLFKVTHKYGVCGRVRLEPRSLEPELCVFNNCATVLLHLTSSEVYSVLTCFFFGGWCSCLSE